MKISNNIALCLIFLCLPVGGLLSACAEMAPSIRSPHMSFENLQKVEVDVARIEVRNDYQPPMQNPNVEHLFSTPPYIAAESLAKRQIIAVGNDNVLRVIIADASVVREDLPVEEGFWGMMAHEPAEKLQARLLLRFELVNEMAPDIILGSAEVVSNRTKTLMEGTSLAARERATFSLTEDLMKDLNDAMLTVVRDTFGRKN